MLEHHSDALAGRPRMRRLNRSVTASHRCLPSTNAAPDSAALQPGPRRSLALRSRGGNDALSDHDVPVDGSGVSAVMPCIALGTGVRARRSCDQARGAVVPRQYVRSGSRWSASGS